METRQWSRFGAIVIVVLACRPGWAETLHHGPHLEHTSWIIGVKAVQLNIWEEEEAEESEDDGAEGGGGTHRQHPAGPRDISLHGIGGGIFVERTLQPHVEMELSVSAIPIEGDIVVPIDLLLKKPFQVRPWFHPYLAFGPAVTIELVEDAENEAFAGVAFATGAYFWVTDHAGVDLDIDYTMVFKHGLAHELQIALGPVIRF